jgi:hypothetical protein
MLLLTHSLWSDLPHIHYLYNVKILAQCKTSATWNPRKDANERIPQHPAYHLAFLHVETRIVDKRVCQSTAVQKSAEPGPTGRFFQPLRSGSYQLTQKKSRLTPALSHL